MNESLIKHLQSQMPNATLIAATKYVSSEQMKAMYSIGLTHFGENRVQDFLLKKQDLQHLPITWHFIGHLQTNKVKMMINEIDYLHSLDRLPLAKQIQKYREQPLPCFIEVHISSEPTKFGLDEKDVLPFIQELHEYATIKIVGLMGMAEETQDETKIRSQFQTLIHLQKQVQALNLPYAPCLYLSMGMSNDYQIAYEMGSTHLRLGRILL